MALNYFMLYINKMYCNYSNKYKCKNNVVISLNKTCVCLNHFNMNYKNHLLKIQKCYKGFIVRKKLKNLFYNLPRDIQTIVLYYIKLSYYHKCYYKKIENIIYKKSIQLYSVNDKFDINYLKKSYYLFNKYNQILNLNFLKYIYIINKNFLYQLNYDIYTLINNNYDTLIFTDDIFYSQHSFIIFNDSYNFNNIFNTLNILNNYNKLYEKKYKINKFIN